MVVEAIIIVIALIISALMAAIEKTLHEVDREKVRTMHAEGNRRATKVVKLFEESYKLVATSLIMYCIFSMIIIGIVAERFSQPLAEFMYLKIEGLDIDISLIIAYIIIYIITAMVYMIFSVFYPRQIAMQHKEGVAMKLAPYAIFWIRIFAPYSWFVRKVTDLILILTKQEKANYKEAFSKESLMTMLEVGQESGEIKEEGKKMISSIFAFDDKLAYEIMTPRTNVFMIDIEDSTDEYIDELMELRFSRIPVYDGDSDNLIGILNIKDYLIKARTEGFENVDITSILREPYCVPETKNIDSLFFELQREKQHIAILIDEYGGFSGIVTMEDIIEEVMGEINDEYDEAEMKIEKLSSDRYLMSGSMDLDDINEELGTDLTSDNSETIGGFLMDMMGEIPDDIDSEHPKTIILNYKNYVFSVVSIKDRRIENVEMKIEPKKQEESRNEDSVSHSRL